MAASVTREVKVDHLRDTVVHTRKVLSIDDAGGGWEIDVHGMLVEGLKRGLHVVCLVW